MKNLVTAAFVALATLFGAVAHAQEEPAVQAFKPDEQGIAIRVSPLADGLARANQWTALRVTLLNVGEATTATLSLSETMPDGTTPLVYARPIDLPKGARKDVIVPFKPSWSLGTRGLRLETDDGRAVLAPYRLQMVADADVAIGVIGDDALGVNSIANAWGGPVPGKAVRPGSSDRKVRVGLVPTASMPDRAAAYGGLDWLVWNHPDPGDVSAEQMQALRAWVADGGHLLVTVTDNAAVVNASPLADMLPVAVSGVADAPGIDPLLLTLSSSAAGPIATPVATATVREVPGRETWTWATLEDGRPAWVSGTYGLGTVHVVMADPAVAPLSNADRETTWRRLLWIAPPFSTASWFRLYPSWDPGTDYALITTDYNTSGTIFTNVDQWYGDTPIPPRFAEALHLGGSSLMSGFAMDQGLEWGTIYQWEEDLRGHLADIPGVAPLPLSWLLVFSLMYLFAIGPFDYVVLRLIGRQPLTWITFPLYIALFSGAALVGTSLRKGSQAAVVRVELIDQLPGTDLWRGETFLGVFATRKTELELEGGYPGAVVTPLMRQSGAMWDPQIRSDEGPGSLSWRAETWTLAYARSTWTAPGGGTVEVKRIDDGFEVKSTLPFDLVQSDVYVRGQRFPTGPVKAGETKQVHLSSNLTTYYAPPWGYQEIDLRKADPAALEEWGGRQFVARPSLQRGDMDPWAHPAFVGVATTPVEPLVLTGLSPETRAVVYLRVPIDPTSVSDLGSAYGGYTYAGGYTYSPPPPGAPTYLAGSVIRVTELGPNDSNTWQRDKLVGQICTATYDMYPYDAWYYSGTVVCGDGQTWYLSQAKFDVISQPPPRPTEPVYANGSVLEITDVAPSDSYYYDKARLVGMRCTTSGDVVPADSTYFTGSMQCTDGTYYWFTKVGVKVISTPPPPIRSASTVTIADVDYTDGYYYDKARLTGMTCYASGDIYPIDAKWYSGSVSCTDGGYYWFSKVALTVTQAAPEPIKSGTAVTITDIDPYDGYAYDKNRLVGMKCAASGDLYAADAKFVTGSLLCADGQSYWFYKVAVDDGSTPDPTEVPVEGSP